MRLKKFLIILCLIVGTMMSLMSFAYADSTDDVYITFDRGKDFINCNFKQVQTEAAYLSENGVTYVPLHTFADVFNVDISWNGDLQQVTLQYNDKTMLLQIEQKAAMINNSLMVIDNEPTLKESVTMVPLRLFTDFVGASVSLSGETIIVQKGNKPSFYEESHNIIYPPANTGKSHTYTIWNYFNWGADSGELISYLGGQSKVGGGLVAFNSKGFVTYGEYYAAAMSAKFGDVGDMVLIIQDDDSIYPVIIADAKRQNCAEENSNEWGHLNGQDLVEFEILSSGVSKIYGTSGSFAGKEFDHYITKVINLGSVYEKPEYIENVKQALVDNGLENSKFIEV